MNVHGDNHHAAILSLLVAEMTSFNIPQGRLFRQVNTGSRHMLNARRHRKFKGWMREKRRREHSR